MITEWRKPTRHSKITSTQKSPLLKIGTWCVGTSSPGSWAPDYATRINFCRSKIRELEHLKFDRKCNLSNIQGDRLHPDTVTLIEKCLNLKKQYIDNVIYNDNFVTAPNPKSDYTSLL